MLSPKVAAVLVCTLLGSGQLRLFAQEQDSGPIKLDGCTFQAHPSEFLDAQSRVREELFTRVRRWEGAQGKKNSPGRRAEAASITRKNFIDDDIFSGLEKAGVPSASLTTDEEFIRRVSLDLTGRLPSPDAITEFVASDASLKRDDLINKLLATPEFT
ncbi:MAG: DUF1549 domain-containing protein, partial [Bryobacteraceae bacterium]|nr:DUF1549 domain-containing protein [Bryobacteraceae bacterium]